MIAARNLVNIAEASRLTGISVSRLYKLTMPKVAGIPCYKVGGAVRFSPEELEQWLTECRRPTMAERKEAVLASLNERGNKLHSRSVHARSTQKETAKNKDNEARRGAGRENGSQDVKHS